MNLKSYLDYVSAFNGRDWTRVAEFYTPDVKITFPIATLSGRAEALAWYTAAHETLFETLVPHTIRFSDGGTTVIVDLTVQFILLGPTEYSPIGECGEAGDVIEVPMHARYTVDQTGLVTSITVEFTGRPCPSGKIAELQRSP